MLPSRQERVYAVLQLHLLDNAGEASLALFAVADVDAWAAHVHVVVQPRRVVIVPVLAALPFSVLTETLLARCVLTCLRVSISSSIVQTLSLVAMPLLSLCAHS